MLAYPAQREGPQQAGRVNGRKRIMAVKGFRRSLAP